jgi:hypothetical protein
MNGFMAVFKAILLTCLTLTILGSSYLTPRIDREAMALRLLRLRAVVTDDVPTDGSDFETAVAIRNHLYQNVPIQAHTGVDWTRPANAYLKATRGDQGQLCLGFALLYLMALESQGIPARYVGLFDNDVGPYNSHATVEFWYQGHWVASDPTLNIMYVVEGRYLSYAELYALAQAGAEYEMVSNGYLADPERIAGLLPSGIEAMRFVVIHPAQVTGHRYDMTLLPVGWDGTIGGVDVTMYIPPYTVLGALR